MMLTEEGRKISLFVRGSISHLLRLAESRPESVSIPNLHPEGNVNSILRRCQCGALISVNLAKPGHARRENNMNPLHVLSFPRIRRDHEAQTEGLKARQIIAQGKRRNASAALGNQSKTNQALEGRQKLF